MKKKARLIFVILFVIILFVTQGKTAYFTKDEAGTTSAQFLKLGIGARALAMGEAYTGLADDVTSIYWNPAGLNHIEDKEFSAMRALWVSDISLNWLAYAQKGLGGSLGAALVYLASGDIAKYDNAGNGLNQSYSDSDTAFIVSYARKVKGLDLGINLKLLDSRLESESATGLAADLGISGRVFHNNNFNFGLVVQNLGSGLKFMNQSAPLPLNIKSGVSYKALKDRLTLTSDLDFPVDYVTNAHFGAEYRYSLGAMDFFPRVGYQTTNVGDLNALTGLSLGFGVTYGNMSINYAWVPYGELGDTNWVDVGFKFGKKKQEKILNAANTTPLENKANLLKYHFALGYSLFAENRYKEAIGEFNKVLELSPGNTESLEYIGKAEDMLNGKTRMKQDEIDVKLAKMSNLFNEAQALFVKGRFQEAINLFERVLEIDPQHTESLNYIKRAREKIFEKLIVLDDKHFDYNTATLTKAGANVVRQNIRILKENPETKIRIEGYTSAAGTTEYNQKLSERRAMAVAAILKEGGISPERLTTIGFGEARPAVFEPSPKRHNSKEAHANMRVLFEIIVK